MQLKFIMLQIGFFFVKRRDSHKHGHGDSFSVFVCGLTLSVSEGNWIPKVVQLMFKYFQCGNSEPSRIAHSLWWLLVFLTSNCTAHPSCPPTVLAQVQTCCVNPTPLYIWRKLLWFSVLPRSLTLWLPYPLTPRDLKDLIATILCWTTDYMTRETKRNRKEENLQLSILSKTWVLITWYKITWA